jgi:hypothetical protein
MATDRAFLARARAMLRAAVKPARNPVPPSSAMVEGAAKLFRDFTGHEPRVTKVATREMTKPFMSGDNPVLAFGELLAVEYETVRDGKTERYRHAFRKQSRPLIAASHDGKSLYILGGEYEFTDRGIVDK